jgi:hypothetical protein
MREHGAAGAKNAHEQTKGQQQPDFHSAPHKLEFVV